MADLSTREEYWLSGPVSGVPDLLQPVAHALLQARDEIATALQGFDDDKLFERPLKLASVGFHLQHIAGVLDRLFTYARAESLSEAQLEYLANEAGRVNSEALSDLLFVLSVQVDKSITYLETVEPGTLTDARFVGRKRLPATVMGLLFHAAEHTMRHCGQLLVTARIVTGGL